MWDTKPFTDNYVDFFRLGFLGSYMSPLIIVFISLLGTFFDE
ncbi:hypothetical protein A3N67_06545 [Enterobacter hormaechei subsp. steigerwaltii]|nr:hypothetical protein A3N67_06545 [Enterobacter hormaechei subsp. steigerwaltii]